MCLANILLHAFFLIVVRGTTRTFELETSQRQWALIFLYFINVHYVLPFVYVIFLGYPLSNVFAFLLFGSKKK